MSDTIDIGLFITLIQGFPNIYDLKHKEYKNQATKGNSWEEISSAMNMPVAECQRQWKTLRDRYTKEKRCLPSGSGAQDSTWEFFSSMSFYDKCLITRKTASVTHKVENTPKDTESRPGSSSSSSVWDPIDVILSPSLQDAETSLDENSETTLCYKEITPTSSGTRGIKRRRDADNELKEVIGLTKNIVENLKEIPSKNHTFALYIEQSLNEIPEDQAKNTRKKIVEIIEEL